MSVSNIIHLEAEVSRQRAGALAADPEGHWLSRRLTGWRRILCFLLTKLHFIHMEWKEIIMKEIKNWIAVK